MHCRHNLLILLLATMVPSSLAAIFPRQDTTTTSSSSTTSASDTSVPTATTTCTSIPPLFLGDRLMENSIADTIVCDADVGRCCHVVGTTYCVGDKWRESHDYRTQWDVFGSYSYCFKWPDKFYWRIECDSGRYARLYGWELCAERDVCSFLSPRERHSMDSEYFLPNYLEPELLAWIFWKSCHCSAVYRQRRIKRHHSSNKTFP